MAHCPECGERYDAPRFNTEANFRWHYSEPDTYTAAERLGTMCACYGVPRSSPQARAEAAWALRFPYLFASSSDGGLWYDYARQQASAGIMPPRAEVEGAPSWSGRVNWPVHLRARISDTSMGAPWHAEAWASGPDHTADEYLRLPHASAKSPGMVSYVASYADGIRGKVTQAKPGRYLARYFPALPAAEVERWAKRWAADFSVPDLQLASTPDDIERVYRNGPRSCMSHSPSSYKSDVHPVRIYGAGDLAVAYIVRGDKIQARTLCWPEKKLHHARIYGASEYLRAALAAAGYVEGRLCGARLLRVEDSSGGFIMPYLDSSGFADGPDDAHFVLDRHSNRSGSQDGVTEGREYLGECDHCGCEVYEDEDSFTEVAGSNWCDDCTAHYASTCEHCECVTAADDMHSVGNEAWCEDCAGRDSTVCARCEERVEDDEIAGQTRKGGSICNSCAEDHYIMCSTHDSLYRNSREYCPECGPADCAHEGCAEQIDGNIAEYCDKHAEQAAEVERAENERRRARDAERQALLHAEERQALLHAEERQAAASGLALAWIHRAPSEERLVYGQPAAVRVFPGPAGSECLAVGYVTGCGRSECYCSGLAGWRVLWRSSQCGWSAPLGPEFPSVALALYAIRQVLDNLGAVDTQPAGDINSSLNASLQKLTELGLLSW